MTENLKLTTLFCGLGALFLAGPSGPFAQSRLGPLTPDNGEAR